MCQKRTRMSSPPSFPAQIARFALVGVAATASHYAILIVLVELTGLHPVAATILGSVVGVTVSYVLNRRYTFRSSAPVASSAAKFAVTYGIGAVINAGIVALLVGQGLWYLFAQVVATLVSLIWNFIGARFVAFR